MKVLSIILSVFKINCFIASFGIVHSFSHFKNDFPEFSQLAKIQLKKDGYLTNDNCAQYIDEYLKNDDFIKNYDKIKNELVVFISNEPESKIADVFGIVDNIGFVLAGNFFNPSGGPIYNKTKKEVGELILTHYGILTSSGNFLLSKED